MDCLRRFPRRRTGVVPRWSVQWCNRRLQQPAATKQTEKQTEKQTAKQQAAHGVSHCGFCCDADASASIVCLTRRTHFQRRLVSALFSRSRCGVSRFPTGSSLRRCASTRPKMEAPPLHMMHLGSLASIRCRHVVHRGHRGGSRCRITPRSLGLWMTQRAALAPVGGDPRIHASARHPARACRTQGIE